MIVITSIFAPTDPVRKFASLDDIDLIVVGDRKTPSDWKLDGVDYLGVDEQNELPYSIARQLPWDHYARKNLGYLRAIHRGASVIRESDDDNRPYADWNFPNFDGAWRTLSGADYVNIYKEFTDSKIWPRGLPLDVILSDPKIRSSVEDSQVGVWQGLADGDPDVDAIYRLTVGESVTFRDDAQPVVLAEGTVCPFNSQNTAFRKECFPLLYLPATVTFRFTDILRGLVAQPVMAAAGFRLGFTKATVFQDRNEHNFMRDFESEIPCYLEARKVITEVSRVVDRDASIAVNLRTAYEALVSLSVVPDSELPILDAWLSDLRDLGL